MCFMIVACIWFWSSYVFYNSFLPEIAAPEDPGERQGIRLGYVGSVLMQMIGLRS